MARFYRPRPRPKRKRKLSNYKKKKQLMRPQRGMTPSIHIFRRSVTQTISLDTTSVPEGWFASGNNLYKNWGFSLSSLGDWEEFKNLFKYYRIMGARVQMYFSNTNSVPTMGSNMYYSNSQVLLHYDSNRDGEDSSTSGLEMTYLNSQTAKKKLCLNTLGKPVDIYMPLRQQSMIYGGAANTDYATVRPKWIATTEPTTAHFGYKTMLQRVDGQSFGSLQTNKQAVKIVTTLYFQCKKVE